MLISVVSMVYLVRRQSEGRSEREAIRVEGGDIELGGAKPLHGRMNESSVRQRLEGDDNGKGIVRSTISSDHEAVLIMLSFLNLLTHINI